MWLMPEKKATPLIVGELVHLALEHLQKEGVKEALKRARDHYDSMQGMVIEGQEPRIWPVVEKVIKEYAIEYATDPFVTLQTEYPFAIVLPNSEIYRGKLDKLVTMANNYFIMEHKTSAEAPASFFKRFDRGRQITGYFLAALKMDLPSPVMGVVVDALFKPRLNKSGLGQVTFQRELFTRAAFSLDSFIDNTTRVVDEIRARDPEVMAEWPENEDSCHGRFGSTCQYIDICKYGTQPVLLEQLAVRSPYPPDAEED